MTSFVVVDDASIDETARRVEAWDDDRITLHRNDRNVGYVRAFERALGLTSGTYVFLADQDDVWPPGRVAVMVAALDGGAVVVGNVAPLDGPAGMRGPFGESDWRLHREASDHAVRNLVRLAASDMPYFGSAMAIRRDLLDYALPFPAPVHELHDAWLALLGLFSGTMVHVDDNVVLRRVHQGNASGRVRSPALVLHGRWYFVGMCAAAWRRSRAYRRAVAASGAASSG